VAEKKVTVVPLDGSPKFQIPAEDAQAYAMQTDADGAPMYSIGGVDAVITDPKGGNLRRSMLDSSQLKALGEAGRGVSTSQEAYNLAAQQDKRKGEVEATKGAQAGFVAGARVPGVSNFIEDAVLGEDAGAFRDTLKEERPIASAVGDAARLLATGGALGLYSGAAGLVGYAGNAGRLAQVLTGVGLGAAGGAAENTILEVMHAVDNDKPLTGEMVVGAMGPGALIGGVFAGAVPAVGATIRGLKGGAKFLASEKTLTGNIGRKVFKGFKNRALAKSAQREAYEKALIQERKIIEEFTPEKFATKTDTARRQALEDMKKFGAVTEVTYEQARQVVPRLRAAKAAVKSLDKDFSKLPVAESDRFGSKEWRRSFNYEVTDADGAVKKRWGWDSDAWSQAQEEMRLRIDMLSDAGYGPEAKTLEELLSPAHAKAPGVVGGRLFKQYHQASIDLLNGREGAAAVKEAIGDLLQTGGMWNRTAQGINRETLGSIDDAVDALRVLRGMQLPDKFDGLGREVSQTYKTVDVMTQQANEALAQLQQTRLFSTKQLDAIRNKMSGHLRTSKEAAEAAETAAKMSDMVEEARRLNSERLGTNQAPTVGSETVVAVGEASVSFLSQMDQAIDGVLAKAQGNKWVNRFEKGRIGVYAVRDLTNEEQREFYGEVREMLGKTENLEARVEYIGERVERVAATDSGIADAMAQQMLAQREYLAAHLPDTPVGAYGEPLPPADSEIESFMEIVGAMESWPSVLASVADGTVTPEAVQAMRSLSPALYDRSRADLAQVVEATDPFDWDPTIAASINLFMGELDPIYTPEFILRLQEVGAQQQQLQQEQAQQQQPARYPNSTTSVPSFQNPQSGVTPGERVTSI
jgi:hypothetical protein